MDILMRRINEIKHLFHVSLLNELSITKINMPKKFIFTTISNAVFNRKTKRKSQLREEPSLIIPKLTRKQINEITTLTGICIGQSHISWIRFGVSPSITILDWNAKILPEHFRSQTNEPEILKLAHSIKHSLPKSDLYVMETFSIKGYDLYEKINEIHLSSMLAALLNDINRDTEWKQNVVFQNKCVLNQSYGLVLGSKRLPSIYLTDNIIQKNANLNEQEISEYETDTFPAIDIFPKCLNTYKDSILPKKEDLSTVFLLTLSFIQINILKKSTDNLKSVECK